jgi:hypothetical protein
MQVARLTRERDDARRALEEAGARLGQAVAAGAPASLKERLGQAVAIEKRRIGLLELATLLDQALTETFPLLAPVGGDAVVDVVNLATATGARIRRLEATIQRGAAVARGEL